MERMAWRGCIKPGCKAEYIKRHNEIWPEMVEVLKKAGIVNYTIFADGDELFGYRGPDLSPVPGGAFNGLCGGVDDLIFNRRFKRE